MTLTGRVFFFFKLLLNGASHETKFGCITLVWAGTLKNIIFIFVMRRPLKHTAAYKTDDLNLFLHAILAAAMFVEDDKSFWQEVLYPFTKKYIKNLKRRFF